jgi:hypothetical protein
MAANVAQIASVNEPGDSASLDIVMASTVAGGVIEVFPGMVSNSAVDEITDTQGNTYVYTQEVIDGTTNWKGEHWRAENIIGGANTVTVVWTFTAGDRSAVAKEIRDVTVLDSFAAANPATPTTGTDALSSGNATVVQQPGIISGFAVSTISSAQPTAGTGFANDGGAQAFFGSTYGYRAESKRITATGAQAATFTATANERHIVLMAVYRERQAGKPAHSRYYARRRAA